MMPPRVLASGPKPCGGNKHKNFKCEPAQHKHKHKKMENFPFSYAYVYVVMLRV